MSINEAIAEELKIPESMITNALKVARSQVKIFTINKKTVGKRKIFHPSKKLKTIQYWLMNNIFEDLPVHDSAMGFREGVSILDNAEIHSGSRYFLRLDLKDFFPSIKYSDLIPIIDAWYLKGNLKWDLNKEAKDLIRKSCFYKQDRLAIGYPSSPIISNIVMFDFDMKVTSLISNKKYGEVLYTRYADDLVFSTNTKGACKEIKNLIMELIKNHKSPDISVNPLKTKLGSSTGGSAAVTGLKICSDGHITIHRKQKDHIRLLLSLFSKKKLNEDEYQSLLGHLTYSQYVAPAFYSSISKKYFKEIHTLRSMNFGDK